MRRTAGDCGTERTIRAAFQDLRRFLRFLSSRMCSPLAHWKPSGFPFSEMHFRARCRKGGILLRLLSQRLTVTAVTPRREPMDSSVSPRLLRHFFRLAGVMAYQPLRGYNMLIGRARRKLDSGEAQEWKSFLWRRDLLSPSETSSLRKPTLFLNFRKAHWRPLFSISSSTSPRE
jgi:hypothetical protein